MLFRLRKQKSCKLAKNMKIMQENLQNKKVRKEVKKIMDEKIIPKLKTIVGQELKYCELCEAIDISKVGTRQKINQLKQLQMYCDFEILLKPTRYVIKEVYENEIKAFSKINGNNKYQMMFDAIVYQTFLENDGQPIYVSTLDMLQLFSEVNENFVYTCNFENMAKLGEDFIYFTEMGQIAKKMLSQWTNNRLKNMAVRNFIVKEKAYRLYTEHKGQYGKFRIGHDFNVGSDIGKKCMAIMAQAIEEIVPNKYIQKATNEKEEDKMLWMPLPIYNSLQIRIAQLTQDEFNGEYCDLKEISLLRPPDGQWIYKKLNETYSQLPALKEINKEACKKILTSVSSSLDKFTGIERKRFVEVNIKSNPKISLRRELEIIRQGEK